MKILGQRIGGFPLYFISEHFHFCIIKVRREKRKWQTPLPMGFVMIDLHFLTLIFLYTW